MGCMVKPSTCALALVLGACNCAAPKSGGSGPAPPIPSVSGPSPNSQRVTHPAEEESTLKIRMTINDDVLTATLANCAATRDFLSLLPLTIMLRDYGGTEKVSDLPSRLSTADAPSGVDPDIGDITYCAPWGNLAIFHRDFGFANRLVKPGHVDSGIEKLANRRGDFTARFLRDESSR